MPSKRLRSKLKTPELGAVVYELRPTGLASHIGHGQDGTRAEAIAADGRNALSVAGRASGSQSVRRFLEGQKETAPVVAKLRRSARY